MNLKSTFSQVERKSFFRQKKVSYLPAEKLKKFCFYKISLKIRTCNNASIYSVDIFISFFEIYIKFRETEIVQKK